MFYDHQIYKMTNMPMIAAIALLAITAVRSAAFAGVPPQINDLAPVSLTGAFANSSMPMGNTGALFANLLENSPTPSEFIAKASKSLFDMLSFQGMNLSGHPKPDNKTKRAYIKLNLRVTHRRINNAHDIRKFLDHDKAADFVEIYDPCEGVDKHCDWLDLIKKQLGRIAENIADEIEFIEEILKKKDCPYLRMRLAVDKTYLDTVQTMVKYIDEHNKLADDHKDFIELLKHIVDNDLKVLRFIEEYLKSLLVSVKDEVQPVVRKGHCPYLDLQQKIQWRETVNRADGFAFVFWLNHRWRNDLEGRSAFSRKLRGMRNRLINSYGNQNEPKMQNGQELNAELEKVIEPIVDALFSSVKSMLSSVLPEWVSGSSKSSADDRLDSSHISQTE